MPEPKPRPAISFEKVYDQVCTDIRITDDISFKLLGLVPLISGLGLTIIPLTVKYPNPGLLVFLSLFAACITLGLFRWELWNIKKCRLLIAFAQKLEQKVQEQNGLKSIRTASRPQGIGKREAEKFIYSIIVLAWLVFPGLFLSSVQFDKWLWMIHLPLAAVIIFSTIISLFASTEQESEAFEEVDVSEHNRH